jgi:hypothetical protein
MEVKGIHHFNDLLDRSTPLGISSCLLNLSLDASKEKFPLSGTRIRDNVLKQKVAKHFEGKDRTFFASTFVETFFRIPKT